LEKNVGVFDFVKEAGSKIGIGESKDEQEAAAARAKAETKSATDERAAEIAKRIKDRKEQAAASAAKAERAEVLAESKKSVALESYISGLGFDVKKLDIRYDDGLAVVRGDVPDQSTREKIILAIGNSEGVEKVDEELQIVAPVAAVAAPAAPASQMHVVVRGDTLGAIAKHYYGDASKYPVIFEANKPMLSDPDKIYPGQLLAIPAI
jgi:nucleoid-associated protein YgaU